MASIIKTAAPFSEVGENSPGSHVVLTRTGPLWQLAMTLSVHPGSVSRARGSCLGLVLMVVFQGLCRSGARVEFLDSVWESFFHSLTSPTDHTQG